MGAGDWLNQALLSHPAPELAMDPCIWWACRVEIEPLGAYEEAARAPTWEQVGKVKRENKGVSKDS